MLFSGPFCLSWPWFESITDLLFCPGHYLIQGMLFCRSVLCHDHDLLERMLFSRSVFLSRPVFDLMDVFQGCSSSSPWFASKDACSRSVPHHMICFKRCCFPVLFFIMSMNLIQRMLFSGRLFLSRPLVALKDAVFRICSSFKGCCFPGLFFITTMISFKRCCFPGLYFAKRCPKGKACNFMHVFRNPGNEFWEADRDFQNSSRHDETPRWQPRSERRGHPRRSSRSRSRSRSRTRDSTRSYSSRQRCVGRGVFMNLLHQIAYCVDQNWCSPFPLFLALI